MHEQTAWLNRKQASAVGFDSVSVPTYRGSTIVYPDYRSFVARGQQGRDAYTYGLHGTPTTRTLASLLSELEGGTETFLVPSGLMAITTAILSVVEQGETILLPDNVYPPVRRFANLVLPKFGIHAKFYNPANVSDSDLNDESIRLVWMESPGSTTMEIQDLPAISALAHARGILVGCDNSWATPMFCKPLQQGADIVVEAITK